MKKVVTILLVAFLGALLFSSCKSHETCPAYSQVTDAQELVA